MKITEVKFTEFENSKCVLRNEDGKIQLIQDGVHTYDASTLSEVPVVARAIFWKIHNFRPTGGDVQPYRNLITLLLQDN